MQSTANKSFAEATRRDATRPVNREKKNLCQGETLRKGKSRLEENKGEKEQSGGREKV